MVDVTPLPVTWGKEEEEEEMGKVGKELAGAA